MLTLTYRLVRSFAFLAFAGILALNSTSRAAVLSISDVTFTGSFTASTPENLTGVANMSGLTTTEGTFTSLTGATANNVASVNANQSIGYNSGAPSNGSFTPSTNDATGRDYVTSGLLASAGVNNMTTGNFQFGLTFDANTRFFVIDTTPVSSTVGDNFTVTLINSSNTQVGTFTLNVLATQFTNSPANTTNTALATVTYTQNQNANYAQKLGGVTFSLADLGVTDYSAISTATGIRINGNGLLDPNIIGTFSAVPEPGTYALLLGGLSMLVLLRRRFTVRR